MGVIIYGLSLAGWFSQNHLNWAFKIIKKWIDIIFERISTAFISTGDFSRMTIRIDRADLDKSLYLKRPVYEFIQIQQFRKLNENID